MYPPLQPCSAMGQLFLLTFSATEFNSEIDSGVGLGFEVQKLRAKTMEASEELLLWMPIFIIAIFSCLFVDILGL